MKSKSAILLGGITLLAFLSIPIRPGGAGAASARRARSEARKEHGKPGAFDQPTFSARRSGAGWGWVHTDREQNGIRIRIGGELERQCARHHVRQRLAVDRERTGFRHRHRHTAWVTVVSPGGGTSNLVFFPITIPTSTLSFTTSAYDTGSSPWSVKTGDFNGDGKADLALTDNGSDTVSILLGNGDGTVQNPVQYPAGPGPAGLTSGDFNGDGKLDLVVANGSVNAVSILLGNVDGTFQNPVQYATGDGPGGNFGDTLATGDFNGDGKLDLAVADANSNAVSILLGNGDGSFKPHVDYPSGGNGPNSVAVGDLNADGNLDLVVANYNLFGGSSIATVLLGNGDGTFSTGTSLTTGPTPRTAILADFNGDGKLDVVLANQDSSTISIFLGNGDGTFQPRVDFTTTFGPGSLSPGDLNGDGKLDLAIPDFGYGGPGSNSFDVLLGNGDGTFQAPLTYSSNTAVEGALADFNGDGRLDFADIDLNNNTVSIQLQVTGPLAILSPSSLNFGTQLIKTTSNSQTVTLSNTGIATLDISSITGSPNFVKGTTCGTTLAAGASCHFLVWFEPSTLGTVNGTLTITDNAPGSPQTVSLTGVGTEVSLSPTSLNFGSQPVHTQSYQDVTFTNHGNRALSILKVSFTGADPTDYSQTNTCGSSVAAGASCTFSVTFTPRTTGRRTATLNITDDGGASPQTIALSGTGT